MSWGRANVNPTEHVRRSRCCAAPFWPARRLDVPRASLDTYTCLRIHPGTLWARTDIGSVVRPECCTSRHVRRKVSLPPNTCAGPRRGYPCSQTSGSAGSGCAEALVDASGDTSACQCAACAAATSRRLAGVASLSAARATLHTRVAFRHTVLVRLVTPASSHLSRGLSFVVVVVVLVRGHGRDRSWSSACRVHPSWSSSWRSWSFVGGRPSTNDLAFANTLVGPPRKIFGKFMAIRGSTSTCALGNTAGVRAP